MFEGLNISAGRGTEKPFEYIGAPWIDYQNVATILNGLNLKGVIFDTVTFYPFKMPFHSRAPIYAGESCKGIWVNVTDRDRLDPYRTGIAMIWAFYNWEKELASFKEISSQYLIY